MIIGRERRNPITNNITKKKNSKDNNSINMKNFVQDQKAIPEKKRKILQLLALKISSNPSIQIFSKTKKNSIQEHSNNNSIIINADNKRNPIQIHKIQEATLILRNLFLIHHKGKSFIRTAVVITIIITLKLRTGELINHPDRKANNNHIQVLAQVQVILIAIPIDIIIHKKGNTMTKNSFILKEIQRNTITGNHNNNNNINQLNLNNMDNLESIAIVKVLEKGKNLQKGSLRKNVFHFSFFFFKKKNYRL